LLAGPERGAVALTAQGLRLDENFMALFPEPMAGSLRRLQPSGYADLFLERLSYERVRPEDPLEWAASGTVLLRSVSLPALKMSDISGELTLSGILGHPEEGTLLAGELSLEQARLLNRELTTVQTPWSFVRTKSGVGELSFDRIRADAYGGDLSGRSDIRFDSSGAEYNLTGVISRMDLPDFLNAGRPTDQPPVEAQGSIVANLYLSGEFGDLTSMRGGGRFEILDGDLYRLPIILAILNVLELKARPTESFNEATADFYIVGRKVTLRDIIVRGGVLALIGSGALTLPDLAVDLRLINVPDQWWAKLPGVSQIMQGAVRELVQVRVTGPVSQPNVRTEPVPRITEELRSLFQRRLDRRSTSPGGK
jgi:hypothetical protein